MPKRNFLQTIRDLDRRIAPGPDDDEPTDWEALQADRAQQLQLKMKDIKALLNESRCPECHLNCVHSFRGGSEDRVYFNCNNPYCQWSACAFPADLEAGNYVDLL